MRAETLTFEDIFKVDADSGRITLGSDRYILLDADALGRMRKELIENLGVEVACGILERVGFQSGRNDAARLRERYPWPSEEEWLRAGPRLHYLEGIVRVGLTFMDVDRAESRFFVAGEWHDSYEAEQHIKHFGIGDRTVCWTLEGYATGYATEFFGEEIVCMEISCRAKGDPNCAFELRPAREWGARARPLHELLTADRFTERFDRCLHSISVMGCELEQTSLDAIITTDRHGRITSCSQGGADLLGFFPGEAVGRSIGDSYAGGEQEAHHLMRMVIKSGRIRNYLTKVIVPGGRQVPVALSASAIRNGAGEVIGTLAVAHNLTELRRLEDELARKARFMANILQDSADAIITLDLEDVITSWNRGAETVFGYLEREVIGKHLSIIIPSELQEANELSVIGKRLKKQGAVRSFQTERIAKDGRRLQVIFTRTAIFDESGNFIGSSAVVKDVTNYRSLERQLARAEHLATLGELSAGLAHEIKNPLAGIRGAIEVIQDSMEETETHHGILGDVLHEVDRIDKIVRDLLKYAKPKQSEHGAIDLATLAERILSIVRQSGKDGRVSLHLDQSTPIPGFTGDESQIEQILLNLLLNAQDALTLGGEIRMRLSYQVADYTLRIEVEDNGPGIPEEIRGKIFQPFFTTRREGTGLGLATCLKNVEYHGGTIEVHSEQSRGTRFVVQLPMLCRM